MLTPIILFIVPVPGVYQAQVLAAEIPYVSMLPHSEAYFLPYLVISVMGIIYIFDVSVQA
jgi:hypothetical protein